MGHASCLVQRSEIGWNGSREFPCRTFWNRLKWVTRVALCNPVPDPLLLRKSGSAWDRTRDLCICSQKLWPIDNRGGSSTKLKNVRAYLVAKYQTERGNFPLDSKGKVFSTNKLGILVVNFIKFARIECPLKKVGLYTVHHVAPLKRSRHTVRCDG